MAKELTRGELLRLMDLATRCLSVNSPGELAAIISDLCPLMAFKKAVICKLHADREHATIDEYINHSYGARWANLYTCEGFANVDPILGHSVIANGAFDWREVKVVGSGNVTKFLDAAQDFGIINGVSFVCGDSRTLHRTLLSLAGLRSSSMNRAGAILTAFGPHLHEAYRQISADQTMTTGFTRLTPRETEVLNWRQLGKTYWEIGSILGISQRTVKYHFARIATKLDVVGASHALAKALRLGIIH